MIRTRNPYRWRTPGVRYGLNSTLRAAAGPRSRKKWYASARGWAWWRL